jgi:hypothetical protein
VSYPPQPGQDPNNPYAQQPQAPQQQGYGYPQQPQAPQQPGYGYPQQQGGLPSYGGPAESYPMGAGAGYGAMTEMPGPVKTVRIIMFVFGGLACLGAVLMIIGAAALGSTSGDSLNSDTAAMGAGALAVMAVFMVANAVYSFFCAVKAKSGSNGWRIATIVLGALSIAGGLFSLVSGSVPGIVNIALGVLIIVFMSKAEAKAWYSRPRY